MITSTVLAVNSLSGMGSFTKLWGEILEWLSEIPGKLCGGESSDSGGEDSGIHVDEEITTESEPNEGQIWGPDSPVIK